MDFCFASKLSVRQLLILSTGPWTVSLARGLSVLALQARRQKRSTQIQGFFFLQRVLKVSQNKYINVKKYNTDLLCKLDLDPVVANWQVVRESNVLDILLFEC
jgi:hypothetical protein